VKCKRSVYKCAATFDINQRHAAPVKIREQKFPITLTLGTLDGTSAPTDAMRQTFGDTKLP
jgi:hypothetical protein